MFYTNYMRKRFMGLGYFSKSVAVVHRLNHNTHARIIQTPTQESIPQQYTVSRKSEFLDSVSLY